MTNATLGVGCAPRDRPAAMTVSPEMISAGVSVLEEHLHSYCHSTLVEAVYIVMKGLEKPARRRGSR